VTVINNWNRNKRETFPNRGNNRNKVTNCKHTCNSTISAALINARSLRNKFRELESLVLINKWDVITINETWVNADLRDFIGEYGIDGYKLFHKDRVNRMGVEL
jgi:hypothetical protein